MNTIKKRGICCLLVALLFFVTGVQSYAALSEEAEPLVSNRYTFVVEKGTNQLLSTTTYTNSQINTQAKIKIIVENSTEFMSDVPAAYADVLIATFYDVHQFGTAARVKVYSRLDKRYRVDSVTGKKTSAGSRYAYTFKFYTRSSDGSYDLYKTHTFTQADYR